MKTLRNTKNLVTIAMLGAVGALLMLWELPLTFVAPSFYKLDFSEVPVLIGTFALGPVAGVLTETVKILIKLVIKPTTTGGVGELANFIIGCAMVLPAGLLYLRNKTRKTAYFSLGLGTLTMTAVGVVVNATVLLPFYSKFMPLEQIVAAGSAIFPAVNSVWSFALWCVAPFNLIKGIAVSLLTALLYKRISRVIKEFGQKNKRN